MGIRFFDHTSALDEVRYLLEQSRDEKTQKIVRGEANKSLDDLLGEIESRNFVTFIFNDETGWLERVALCSKLLVMAGDTCLVEQYRVFDRTGERVPPKGKSREMPWTYRCTRMIGEEAQAAIFREAREELEHAVDEHGRTVSLPLSWNLIEPVGFNELPEHHPSDAYAGISSYRFTRYYSMDIGEAFQLPRSMTFPDDGVMVTCGRLGSIPRWVEEEMFWHAAGQFEFRFWPLR